MNLLSGLEKFGFDSQMMDNLFEDEIKEKDERVAQPVQKRADEPKETDFLYDKKLRCSVCDKDFEAKIVKSSKARRIGADKDLRPIYQYIEPMKYDIISCPYCGYSAMSRYFPHISPVQAKMIREAIGSKFTPDMSETPDIYTYDMAIERYKLSLLNTVVKRGKNSEKAYTCLKMAWLCRGKAEEFIANGMSEESQGVKKCHKEEQYYYEQAYEGLTKAVSSESFPICGMDQNTMDLLLAQMAYKLEKYDTASKLVSRLLVSGTANRNAKDKAYDLKEELVAKLKELDDI